MQQVLISGESLYNAMVRRSTSMMAYMKHGFRDASGTAACVRKLSLLTCLALISVAYYGFSMTREFLTTQTCFLMKCGEHEVSYAYHVLASVSFAE
jgi:hypothetical protein